MNTHSLNGDNKPDNNHPPVFFFYQTTRVEAPTPQMNGAAIKVLIKAHIDTFDPAETLVLEGSGSEADEIIADDKVVDLAHGHGEAPKHFHSKPPTTFGDQPAGIISAIDMHLVRLCAQYPAATITPASGSTLRIHVSELRLPSGWSKSHTGIWFITPTGYPGANPDCFWADADLRLASGGMPQNSAIQCVPETNISSLWFSWHASGWNPLIHDLRAYMSIILARFDSRS